MLSGILIIVNTTHRNELQELHGIGPATFEDIKDDITMNENGGDIVEEQSFQELKEKEAINEKEKLEFETWNGERFYYIAGYTSGGAPYGITLEEYKTENNQKEDKNGFLDGDLPF